MRKRIKCKCGTKLTLRHPAWIWSIVREGFKAHTHCKHCGLEWHLTLEGQLYAHPPKRRKNDKRN
jgi:hypothetical protein